MANPQKENGYTPIANEIMEAVAKVTLSPTGYKILIVVWRQTYGYNRIHAKLSDGFIAKAIGSTRTLVNRELNRLVERNILTVHKPGNFTEARHIGFNKDYEQWDKGAIQIGSTICSDTTIQTDNRGAIQTDNRGAIQIDTGVLSKQIHKERQYKENYKDNNKEMVFEYWNSQKIIVHKSLSDSISKALEKALKANSVEEINTAISRYSTMLRDDSCTWCTYKWGLDTFLTRERGYITFLDDGEKWLSYQNQSCGRGKSGSAVPLGTEVPPEWIRD